MTKWQEGGDNTAVSSQLKFSGKKYISPQTSLHKTWHLNAQ